MSRRRCVVPLVAALLLGGCDELFGPDVSGRLLGLDGRVVFLIREIHGFAFDRVGDPELAIYLATEKEYPCREHVIEAAVGVEGQVITVEVAGVREPELCFAERIPANFRSLLPVEPGTWTLRFRHRDRTDEYVLVIDAAAIDIAGGAAGGVSVPDISRFWRYPPDSFALGCDQAGGYPAICAELADSVAATAGVAGFVFGAGGIPYPVSQDGVQFSWRVSYFTYADASAWAAGRARAAAVLGRYPGLRYYLLNWRNEHVGSWP